MDKQGKEMRTRLILVVVAFCCVSCSIQKRQRLPGIHVEWHLQKMERGYILNSKGSNQAELQHDDAPNELKNEKEASDNKTLEASIGNEPRHADDNIEFAGKLVAKYLLHEKSDSCDLIISRSGDLINATILENDGKHVKFKLCNNADESHRLIAVESVFMIKFKDGSKSVLEQPNESSRGKRLTEKERNGRSFEGGFKSLDPVGLLGFIFGLGGFPVWFFYWQIGFFTSIFAIILGAISIVRILKNRDSRKGLGLAIASLLIGIAVFVATIIIWFPAFV